MQLRYGFSLLFVSLALTTLLLWNPSPHADVAAGGEIVFLTVQIADGTASLVEWNTVPGVLKQSRLPESDGDIGFEAMSAAGKRLWQGAIEDPRIIRLEYIDPDNPDAITGRVLTRDTATFTIRVPARGDIDHLEFSTRRRVLPGLAKARAGASLGSIPWPVARQGKTPE